MYQFIQVMGRPKGLYRKIWLIMRLTTVLMIACLMQVSAAGLAQKITLNERDAPLNAVLKEIRNQSGYGIYFDGKTLPKDQKVTVIVRDATVDEALDAAFRGLNLTYKIEGNIIAVRPKEQPSILDRVIARFQAIDVKGRVVDSLGNGLAGATVSVKNGKISTSTDAGGNFQLKNVDERAVLVVSYLGYVTREIEVSKELMVVALKESKSKLDEVQVIAYGQTSMRLSTGNVAKVTSAEIARQPVQNPLLALQGRVSGLVVNQNSGINGGGVTVRIQGQNSLVRGSDPFYVIDGVPYPQQLLDNGGNNAILGASGGQVNGSPLSYLNPNDIESIEVLKDADATAIYGSRAAAGAILITTKKGKVGETKVDVNLNSGIGRIPERLSLLNTQQYLEMRKEAKKNTNSTISRLDYDINGVWDTTKTTDWQKKLLGNSAAYQTAAISVSGGAQNTRFLISSTYNRQTTVFSNSLSDNKASLLANLNHISPGGKFRLQLSTNIIYDNNSLIQEDLTSIALSLPPDFPDLYNPDGSINWAPNSSGNSTTATLNPAVKYLRTYRNNTTNFLSNANVGYKLLDGMEISSNFGYNRLHSDELNASPLKSVRPELRAASNAIGRYSYNTISTWIAEPQLKYQHSIGKAGLDILAGATFQQNISNRLALSGTGYNSDEVIEDVQQAQTRTIDATQNTDYRYTAIFSRIGLNWENRYLVNLSARRDGSTRYGPKNRFNVFSSIGAAWIISDEPFFKGMQSMLSFLKIRGSYGSSGNDQISDYAYLSLYDPTTYYTAPYQGSNTLEITRLNNPYLQWEKTKKMQVGLDIGFWHDKLLLNINYALNRSSNQLLLQTLPWQVGFPFVDANLPAVIENRDWEFALNSTNISTNSFVWMTGANLTVASNKLKKAGWDDSSIWASMFFENQPVTYQRVYSFAGVDPQTGLYRFRKSDGSLTTNPSEDQDRNVFINTSPPMYGGISNNFRYKGFELDFLFQFVKQKAQGYNFGYYPGQRNANQPVYVLNRWRSPNDLSKIQKFDSNGSFSAQVDQAINSDANWEDASFVRLKNASLSWRAPITWTKALKVRSVSLYVNAQNVWTITNYSGLDPETKSTLSLPSLRVFVLGAKIGL